MPVGKSSINGVVPPDALTILSPDASVVEPAILSTYF